MNALIITAPQGSGKSEISQELMRHFRHDVLVDPWEGGPLPRGALALTNLEEFPEGVDVMSLEEALAHMACSKSLLKQ